MQYNHSHAGNCCGIGVIYGFDNATVEGLDANINWHDRRRDNGRNRLLEVVLSERQVVGGPVRGRAVHNVRPEIMALGGWPAILRARGFRLVSRFNNSNSGQNCYVFHRHGDFLSLEDADLPFSWNVPEPEPEPAPIVTYHNYYQNTGTYGCAWASVEECRRRNPRVLRVDRCTTYPDGRQEWEQNVQ